MKLGLLTSVETRHRYFANALRARFNVVAVGYEETGYSPADTPNFNLTPEEQRIVEEHFAERARQENIYFGSSANWIADSDNCGVLNIAPAELNSKRTLDFLHARGVDAVAVYGTNLIKAPFIDCWLGRMINLHLGLSPYYRGTGTNFYPLLNGEPEYVGATIHMMDPGIDSGPILCHARPRIVADDMPHTIGCKAILAGLEGMIAVLADLEAGRDLTPVPQWKPANAKLYLRKDYDPRQVVEMYAKLKQGLIRNYVRHTGRNERRIKLVGPIG